MTDTMSKQRRRVALVAVAVLVAVIGGPLEAGRTLVQVPGYPTIEVLAAGFNAERFFQFFAKGPTDVLQVKVVAQPGDDTGWHSHPGPAITVVQSGAIVFYRANGCVSVYPAGSAIFEETGLVHRVINQGGVAAEAYKTALAPHGIPVIIPEEDPGPRRCRPSKRAAGDERK